VGTTPDPNTSRPPEALRHVPPRQFVEEEPQDVAVFVYGGAARFAVEGILEIISTMLHDYALAKWMDTFEPIPNVDEEDMDSYMENFASNGFRQPGWL
jgi:hypothetical protein